MKTHLIIFLWNHDWKYPKAWKYAQCLSENSKTGFITQYQGTFSFCPTISWYHVTEVCKSLMVISADLKSSILIIQLAFIWFGWKREEGVCKSYIMTWLSGNHFPSPIFLQQSDKYHDQAISNLCINL